MDCKSMPKFSLFAWVWDSTVFRQLISCYKLWSCHKENLTSEIDWGIAYLTVCWKSLWLDEFEIQPYFDSLSGVTGCERITIEID